MARKLEGHGRTGLVRRGQAIDGDEFVMLFQPTASGNRKFAAYSRTHPLIRFLPFLFPVS
jgi:hypothetical protein